MPVGADPTKRHGAYKAVPYWREEVQTIILTHEQIRRRVRRMARQIQSDFAGGDLVVVAILNGTVLFLADLIRELSLPLRLDFVGVSSYREDTRSGDLVFTKDLRLDVRGRDVLLVDDILDSGKTLARVWEKLTSLKPRQIKTCVLLEKMVKRTVDIKADYVGFPIPNAFVVGYGLDYAEKYRNLPFIGVLKGEV
jgi:hypoxanthine phosphoribosyltransferase